MIVALTGNLFIIFFYLTLREKTKAIMKQPW